MWAPCGTNNRPTEVLSVNQLLGDSSRLVKPESKTLTKAENLIASDSSLTGGFTAAMPVQQAPLSTQVGFVLLLLLATGIHWSITRETVQPQQERAKPMKKTKTNKLVKSQSALCAVSFMTTVWAALTSYCGCLLP
jgi:hypothetical protein